MWRSTIHLNYQLGFKSARMFYSALSSRGGRRHSLHAFPFKPGRMVFTSVFLKKTTSSRKIAVPPKGWAASRLWLMTTVTAVLSPIAGSHRWAFTGRELLCPKPLPDRAKTLLLRRTQTPSGSELILSHFPPRALATPTRSSLKDTIFGVEPEVNLSFRKETGIGKYPESTFVPSLISSSGVSSGEPATCTCPRSHLIGPASPRPHGRRLRDPSVPAPRACKAKEGHCARDLLQKVLRVSPRS